MASRIYNVQVRLTDLERAALDSLIKHKGWRDRSKAVRRMMNGEATLDEGMRLFGVEPPEKKKREKFRPYPRTIIDLGPGPPWEQTLQWSISNYRWKRVQPKDSNYVPMKYVKKPVDWSQEDKDDWAEFQAGKDAGKWKYPHEYAEAFPDPVPDYSE